MRNTKFKDNGARLALFRVWLVLHELVQFYLYFLTGSETEVLDINDAVALGGKASARNTRNYIYYAASKFFPLLPQLTIPHPFVPLALVQNPISLYHQRSVRPRSVIS